MGSLNIEFPGGVSIEGAVDGCRYSEIVVEACTLTAIQLVLVWDPAESYELASEQAMLARLGHATGLGNYSRSDNLWKSLR